MLQSTVIPFCQLAHHLPEARRDIRIDSDPRFVEQQHIRGAEQAQASRVSASSARELARRPRGEAGKIGEGEQPREGGRAFGLQYAAQVSVEGEFSSTLRSRRGRTAGA